jgi:uncharacterized delta-60 repeat protein
MTSNYKDGSVWKKTTPYVNVDGNWKIPKSAWTKVSSEWKSWFLQGGINDDGFSTGTGTYGITNMGASGDTETIAIQPDGKILLGGHFTSFNNIQSSRVVRLLSDGSVDFDFVNNIGTAVGGSSTFVAAIAIQPDGKILLGGYFPSFNGITTNSIVRLNSDGSVDTDFVNNIGTGGGAVISISILSDGKILLGGYFTNFNDIESRRIVCLNQDGTRNDIFNTNIGLGSSSGVNTINVQPDEKIIIGGSFTTFNGVTVNKLVRLNSDGTLDSSLNINQSVNGVINSVVTLDNGKIIAVGSFGTFNGLAINNIVCINSDGTVDSVFNNNIGTGANDYVVSVTLQPDGKIILVGFFRIFNGITVNGIVRLNSDGTMDTNFTENTGTGATGTGATAAFNWIRSLDTQSDGKIILVGYFANFNNKVYNNIVRIGGDIAV